MIFFQGCAKEADNLVSADQVGFHPSGWVNASSANFHGKAIAQSGWMLTSCQSCHGRDYKGGNSAISCYDCHSSGPESCNMCHGNAQHIWPPRSLSGNTQNTQQGVGAHDTHLSLDSNLRVSARVACSECHRTVTNFSDTSHISGYTPGVAEVVFGALAKKSIGGGLTPNPTWNPATQKCSNVYCHGYFVNGNLTNQPTFNVPSTGNCGTCHGNSATGDPRPSGTLHQTYQSPCWYCHGSVINSSNVIINKYKHINGVVDFD